MKKIKWLALLPVRIVCVASTVIGFILIMLFAIFPAWLLYFRNQWGATYNEFCEAIFDHKLWKIPGSTRWNKERFHNALGLNRSSRAAIRMLREEYLGAQ